MKKILIVEDEKPLARVLKLKLNHNGFRAKAVFGGKEALKALEREKFDFMILDLLMPGVSGFDVLAKMKSKRNKTPVIISSNLGQIENIQKAHKLGAKDYFVKSDISLTEFIEQMRLKFMRTADKTIKEALLEKEYISPEDIEKAEKYAKNHHTSVAEYFLIEGILTLEILGQVMAEFFGLPYFDLNYKDLSPKEVLKIPEKIAKKYRVVLCGESEDIAIIATDKPRQKEILLQLKKIFKNKKIKIVYSFPKDIEAAFALYRNSRSF